MSFFYKEVNPDLSGKTTEELLSLKTELNEKIQNISSERVKINKTLRLYDIEFNNIDKNLKQILNEFKRREDIEESKSILNPEISEIEGFELLREDELSIITKKMDRTDYRKHGVPIRFYDFKRICIEVINMKKKYPKWTLTDLSRGGQHDTLPPQTFYRYEYKDEYGFHFNIGGIKILNS